MNARSAIALLALSGAACSRIRRARHRAPVTREVDPRAQHATACADPRYVALTRVPVPTVGRATEVAVAGGGGRRLVAWTDDRGVHAWDLDARPVTVPGRSLCDARNALRAMGFVRPDPCGDTQTARGAGRVATLRIEDRGGPALVAAVRARSGRAFEPQQLAVRSNPDERASIVWDGGAFVAAWSEPIHGARPRAYLALLDRDGRRMGSAMRVMVDASVGLGAARVAAAGPDLLIAALRDDGGVELRESGPRGCDEPLLPQPRAALELAPSDGGL